LIHGLCRVDKPKTTMLKRFCDTKLLNDDEDDTKLNNEGNLVSNGRYMSVILLEMVVW
jgi:hypothetical protein